MTTVTDAGKLRMAASHLAGGLSWDSTPEGRLFWEMIYDRLVLWGKGHDTVVPLGSKAPIPGPSTEDRRMDKLQSLLEAHVKCNDALTTQLADKSTRIDQLELECKQLRRKLLAADFTSMGR